MRKQKNFRSENISNFHGHGHIKNQCFYLHTISLLQKIISMKGGTTPSLIVIITQFQDVFIIKTSPWTATPADDVPAEFSAGARHRVVTC